MVRLKDIVNYNKEVTGIGFNSTMVRLKADLPTPTTERGDSFNSTMVRLKVCVVSISAIIITEFQFHNGSIKSVKDDDEDDY